jgi:CDP-diacylglycerol--serine O-phosphatidyltransferase
LGNGLAGFLGIMYIIDKNFTAGMILILIGVILDGADGAIAELLGHSHSFGKHLDSISDTVTFCFAPATLLYVKYYDLEKGTSFESIDNALTVAACMLIVGLGILRLARFIERKDSKVDFMGLPTPAVAILIVLYVHLIETQYIVLSVAILSSLLMILTIEYPKLRGALRGLAGCVIALSILSIWRSEITYMDSISIFTFALINIYVIVGPFYSRRRGYSGRRK